MMINIYKERILNNCIPEPNTGCWLWIPSVGTVKGKMYGRLKIKGKKYVAHRLSYRAFNGEIPIGMIICHKCDQPQCVNPEHLFAGTYKENMDDMYRKKRDFTSSKKTHCAKGHPWIPENIFISKTIPVGRNIKRQCRICMNDFSREYSRKRIRKWQM